MGKIRKNKIERAERLKCRCFNFRMEFGWAEIIALIALIISCYNYYIDTKADLIISNTTSVSALYTNKNGSINYFIFHRGVIINNGNKPVTLLSFVPHNDFGLTLVNANKSSSNAIKKDLPFEIFQIPDSVFTDALFKKQENLLQFTHQGLEKQSYINQLIAPGESYTITLGVKYTLPADKSVRFLVFAGELKFSNRKSISFGSGGDIEYNHLRGKKQ